MSVNRIGPPCPECNSLTTDVITTSRSVHGEFYRRRVCPICGYRFNTIQPSEMIAPPLSVKWKGRKVHINWRRVSQQILALLQ